MSRSFTTSKMKLGLLVAIILLRFVTTQFFSTMGTSTALEECDQAMELIYQLSPSTSMIVGKYFQVDSISRARSRELLLSTTHCGLSVALAIFRSKSATTRRKVSIARIKEILIQAPQWLSWSMKTSANLRLCDKLQPLSHLNKTFCIKKSSCIVRYYFF